ncbi:MAG: hypothetical protein KGZ43_11780, partial [Sulfuritalea sp.]|nr:hypothetical protein [Sulfuritalea sp.]
LIHVDEMLEVAEGNEFQQLRKHGSASVHGPASSADKAGDDTAVGGAAISNRRNRQSAGNQRQIRLATC